MVVAVEPAQTACDEAAASYELDGMVATFILEDNPLEAGLVTRAVCLVVDPAGGTRTGSVVLG